MKTNALLLAFLIGTCSLGYSQDSATSDQISADDLFEIDRIIDIQITVDEKDWDTMRFQSRSFVQALGEELSESPFKYVKADITIDGKLIKNVGLRKKGFLGSLHDERPSLKVRFDKYQDQSPIDGLDRLTLNNNKQDPSRMCQYLTYKFFNDSGTRSPRCSFAMVTVNGNYLGIYSHVESVRTQFLEREFGDGSGDLFEGTICDFFPDGVKKFEKKNKSAKRSKIKKIARLLSEDVVDLAALEKHVDIESFIKFWAMESLVGFWDGYCSNQNNYFIYENPADSKFYFIPWGTDSSFSATTPLPPYRIVPKSVHSKAILPNKLYRISETQKQYDTTLMSFLETSWNEEKILAEMDRVDAMLKGHVMESNTGYSKTVKKFRRFISTRRRNIMREFENGSPKLRSREHLPVRFVTIGTATAEISTKWFDKPPKKAHDVSDVTMTLTIGGQEVELTNAGAIGERSKWPAQGPPPPTIVLSGTRKSDGASVVLGMSLAANDYKNTEGKPVDVNGIYMVNGNFMPKGGMMMVGGTAILEKASTKDGDSIVGKLDLTIRQLRTGEVGKE